MELQAARDFIERHLRLRSERRVADLVATYAPDAVIARYEGGAQGADEIRTFLTGYLAAHGQFDLVHLDALNVCADVIVFGATIETTVGPLQVSEVMVVGDDGRISHHVPGVIGYWGQ